MRITVSVTAGKSEFYSVTGGFSKKWWLGWHFDREAGWTYASVGLGWVCLGYHYETWG